MDACTIMFTALQVESLASGHTHVLQSSKYALYSHNTHSERMTAADLSKSSRSLSHTTTCLPILLFHFGQMILWRAEVDERLVKVVVKIVLARSDFLQSATNVIVKPRELWRRLFQCFIDVLLMWMHLINVTSPVLHKSSEIIQSHDSTGVIPYLVLQHCQGPIIWSFYHTF